MQAGNDRTATVAITPPSDIVLDVARAADPEKYRVAAERLARLRATAPSTETFNAAGRPDAGCHASRRRQYSCDARASP